MQHILVISNLENINLVEGNNDKEHLFTETLNLAFLNTGQEREQYMLQAL